MGWNNAHEWVKFEKILQIPIRNGLTKPKAIRGNGVKMIAMGEIFAQSRIGEMDMDRVPVTEKELDNCSISAGDLLFARQSLVLEGAGKCNIVTDVAEPTVFESHLIRVRIDPYKADPYFVFYYFNSPHGRENMKTIVEQVAAAGIRGSDLIKLSIPCPAVSLQKKISSILRSIDDKIEINNKKQEKEDYFKLSAQAKAIFADRFINLASVPDGWRTGNLLDIANYLNGLAMQKFRPLEDEIGLPVLKIKELRQGSCDSSSEQCSTNIKSD